MSYVMKTTRLYSGVYPMSNTSSFTMFAFVSIIVIGYLSCFLYSMDGTFTSLVWFSLICVILMIFESFKLSLKTFCSKLETKFLSKPSFMKITNDINRLEVRSSVRVCLTLLMICSWLSAFAFIKPTFFIGLLAVFVATIFLLAMLSSYESICFKLRRFKPLVACLASDVDSENTFVFRIFSQGKTIAFNTLKLNLKRVRFIDARGDDNFSCIEEDIDFLHLSAEEVQIQTSELKSWIANKQPQYMLLTPANAARNALYVFVSVAVGSVTYEFCFS